MVSELLPQTDGKDAGYGHKDQGSQSSEDSQRVPEEDLEGGDKEGLHRQIKGSDLNLKEAKVGPAVDPASEVESCRKKPQETEELAEGADGLGISG